MNSFKALACDNPLGQRAITERARFTALFADVVVLRFSCRHSLFDRRSPRHCLKYNGRPCALCPEMRSVTPRSEAVLNDSTSFKSKSLIRNVSTSRLYGSCFSRSFHSGSRVFAPAASYWYSPAYPLSVVRLAPPDLFRGDAMPQTLIGRQLGYS